MLLLDLQHLPRPGGSWYSVFEVINESNGFLTKTSFVGQPDSCSMFSCEKSIEIDRAYRGAHKKCLGQEIDSTCRAARGWKLDLGGEEIYFADCPVVYACIHTAASCPAVKYRCSATYATVPWPLMYLTSVESLTSFARMTNSGNCGSAKSSQELAKSSPVDQVRSSSTNPETRDRAGNHGELQAKNGATHPSSQPSRLTFSKINSESCTISSPGVADFRLRYCL